MVEANKFLNFQELFSRASCARMNWLVKLETFEQTFYIVKARELTT